MSINECQTIKSELQKFIGIFFSPISTLYRINKNPTFIFPILIIILCLITLSILTYDIEILDKISQQSSKASVEHTELLQEWLVKGWIKYIQVVVIPIYYLMTWSILGWILMSLGNSISDNKSNYKTIFAIVCWSNFITLIRETVRTIMILQKETTENIVTSLAIFMPLPEIPGKESLLYLVLNKFDIFTIWQLILIITGISITFKIQSKKSALYICSLWGVWVIISVTFRHWINNTLH